MSSDKSSQLLTREAIRKIALGRSMERINLAPGGISGIGAAHMIRSYVTRIHDSFSDEKFSDYGGTIDVGEYPDEMVLAKPVIHKGVLLSTAINSEGGFLIAPVFSPDVTILMGVATCYAHAASFPHVDILQLNVCMETAIDVTGVEGPNPEDDPSPDHDELETTSNGISIHYMPTTVTITVKNGKDKRATAAIDVESIAYMMDKSEVGQTAGKVVQEANSATVAIADSKVMFDDENATEPPVLGNGLARLMLDSLTEHSKAMIPMLMGMMSPVNMPNFIPLTSRIQKFLSKTSYTG